MPKLRLMLAALVGASLAAGSTVALAGTKTVKIGDNWFVRSDASSVPVARINEGSRVRWIWTGSFDHNVRLKSAPSGVTKSKFKSTTKDEGRFTRTFNVPGTYRFICSLHEYEGQKMTLKVKPTS